MKELTIVWQCAKQHMWEAEWIEYLFRNIPHRTIENLDHSLFIDNSVIVDALCGAPYHNAYIAEMTKRNLNFGMIHLVDENLASDISSYEDCKFVLRNYYRGPMPDHVITIPLGYNAGFTEHTENPPAKQREFTWACVVERLDQNRNTMAEVMSSVPNGNLYIANRNGPRLTPAEMSKIYRDSVFIPCPSGRIIMDSFRTTEALEAGCIPIVERSDYWVNMYGSDFPAIHINSWHEVPDIINQYMQDPTGLDILRNKCYNWWTARKDSVTKNVTELVTKKMFPDLQIVVDR
jgi:hypothetical protein